MIKDNITRDFSEVTLPILYDYLAVAYFLERRMDIPKVDDLVQYLISGDNSWAFTYYLIRNIQRLIYDKNFYDELRTAISIHRDNMEERKLPRTF